jgi:DNA-directed RNA polymerase subunit RPC12/RpoP
MMSASDLPACPACGSREVRAVHRPEEDNKPAATFYACAQCGRDRTDAWLEVQPPPTPEKLAALADQEANERHVEEDLEKGGDS